MYQYTFDEDTTKQILEKTQKDKTVLEKFNEIDNKYNTLASSTAKLQLEKMEYTNLDVQNVTLHSVTFFLLLQH